jgi:hypothetical protein
MRNKMVAATILLVGLWGIWSLKNSLKAMPSFARQTGFECSTCHTVIPKLNELGFRFRAAGFRTTDHMNEKPEYKEIGELYDFRIQNRMDFTHSEAGGKSTNSFQLTNFELTFYPITGAFAKNLATETEIALASLSAPEFENAYVRWIHGSENGFLSVRAGIFHPWEGYGGADRPVSISRPLIQTSAANHTGNTFFTLWNFDQSGLELAYNLKKTTIAATVFNGLYFAAANEEPDRIEPAVGGALTKPSGIKSRNAKDYQLFVNQLLTEDGGGVSAGYYRGTLDLPAGLTGNFFQNNFHRAALYGEYPVTKKIFLLAGGTLGMDQYYNSATGSSNGRFGSHGAFGGVDVFATERATLTGRYDWFDPSDRKKNNEVWAATGAVNMPWNNGFQLIAEFQHKQTKQGPAPAKDKKNDSVQLRSIVIF